MAQILDDPSSGQVTSAPYQIPSPSASPSPAQEPTVVPQAAAPAAAPAAPQANIPGPSPQVAQAAASMASAPQQQAYSGGTPQGQISFGTSYTPDYAALVKTDPEYLLGMHNLELAHNMALQYAGSAGGSVAPLPSWVTNALDTSDPYSKLSQIIRDEQRNEFQAPRQLAGRGMFDSSETPYALEQIHYNRGAQEHDLKQQVADAQAAHAAAAANAAQAASMARANAEMQYVQGQGNLYLDTYKSLRSDPINRPISPTQAFLVDGSTDLYGQPIYSDEDGRLYTSEGKPFYSVKSPYDPQPQQLQSPSQLAAQQAFGGGGNSGGGGGGMYTPADYLADNPMPQGTSNDAALAYLAALSATANQYGYPEANYNVLGYTGSTPMSSIDQLIHP